MEGHRRGCGFNHAGEKWGIRLFDTIKRARQGRVFFAVRFCERGSERARLVASRRRFYTPLSRNKRALKKKKKKKTKKSLPKVSEGSPVAFRRLWRLRALERFRPS